MIDSVRVLRTPRRAVPRGRLLALLLPPTTALYALFNGIGAIVVPSQVEQIDPAAKVANLALLTVTTGIAAMIAIPLGGAVSDRTHSRFGRRTPWLLAAGIACGALTFAMSASTTMVTLMLSGIGLWFVANFYVGPLTAILPDRIPPERRGVAASVIALGTPLGIALGVNFVSRVDRFWAYAAIGIFIVASTFLLVFGAREPSSIAEPTVTDPVGPGFRSRIGEFFSAFFSAFRFRDFLLAFASRFGLFAAYFTVSGYGYYLLQDYIGAQNIPDHNPAIGVSTMLTVTIVAWLLVATVVGWLADRLDRRKVFVGISAIGLAVSLLIPLFWPTWQGMLAYSACIGVSIGTYFAVDLAVMSMVLPDPDNQGRDFGILQAATGLPQVAASAIAGALITWFGGYPALFVFGILAAIVSGILMLQIRSVR